MELPVHTWILLTLCGVATILPLYFFTRSTKILPLSTVGFIQFLGPTLQFSLGYFIFKEFFPTRYFIAFACIWLAVILYIISLKAVQRGGEKNV
jgi:chloramphenicol-sensitive protein RarD